MERGLPMEVFPKKRLFESYFERTGFCQAGNLKGILVRDEHIPKVDV